MKAAKQKRHGTQQSLNAAVKSICDVMRRSNCAGAMKSVPARTGILLLRIGKNGVPTDPIERTFKLAVRLGEMAKRGPYFGIILDPAKPSN